MNQTFAFRFKTLYAIMVKKWSKKNKNFFNPSNPAVFSQIFIWVKTLWFCFLRKKYRSLNQDIIAKNNRIV